MEAISHAGTCLGILAEDGIVLAAECRSTNKLLDNAIPSEKIYKLNELVKFDLVNITLMAIEIITFIGTWCVLWLESRPMLMF